MATPPRICRGDSSGELLAQPSVKAPISSAARSELGQLAGRRAARVIGGRGLDWGG